MLLNLSDRQFDPIAKGELRAILAKSDDELASGLKGLLDMCVNGALCSDFEIRVLDIAWRSYGGKL